jgi:hypothetical protein
MTAPAPDNRLFPILALFLALLGSASMLYYHQGLFMPGVLRVRAAGDLGNGYSFGNDFYQVWLTSHESLRQPRDLYSEPMTHEIQIGLYGRPLDPRIPTDPVDRRVFPYPAYMDLLFWPSAELSFPVARVVAVLGLAALTFASLLFWLRAIAWPLSPLWLAVIALLTFTSYPVLEALFADQLGLFVGFLLAAAILALQRGRLLLSGTLMALTTIKPQMTALVILYLLLWSLHDWRTRKQFCIGLFSIGAALLTGSLLVWPRWIQSWIRTLIAYHGYTRPPLIREVLASPLGPRPAGPATLILFAILMMAAAILGWRNRDTAPNSRTFWLALSLLLAISSITLLPGQAVYDHIILLPGILFLLRDWRKLRDAGRVPRTLVIVGAVVLFWPYASAFALIALRPLLTTQQFFSPVFFSLPIRTAAPFPFAVLALLVYAQRVRIGKESLGGDERS